MHMHQNAPLPFKNNFKKWGPQIDRDQPLPYETPGTAHGLQYLLLGLSGRNVGYMCGNVGNI